MVGIINENNCLMWHECSIDDTQKNIEEFDKEHGGERLPLSELSHKVLLTVDETNRLFGLGICSLRERMREPKCPFVIKVGEKKQLIDREKLEKYVHEHRRF